MKITKCAHSTLFIETEGVGILTDVGSWTPPIHVSSIDVLLITHEHADHCDITKIQMLIAQHPTMQIVTHAGVGALLENAGIVFTQIEAGERIEVRGVSIESCGTDHAIIYGDTSPCRNTGFFIADTLYIPGDALHDVPPRQVQILALPTGGPWMKVSDAIDYAKQLKPEIVIPIHDAMYTEEVRASSISRWIGAPIENAAIRFVNLQNGETYTHE